MAATNSGRPRFSVVINTDGRARALADTIAGLRRLDYDDFEVCIVCGPTPDGTREYVASLGEAVKTTDCPVRNLSQSRNLGIALAAGDIVAFIDDDGIPEPEWLSDLARAFEDPRVGGAGGLVYNQTGYEYQYMYAACDRLGNAITDLKQPAADFNFPYSSKFPYVQGTNSAFRRSALLDIGGFDEEYEFYLDETDVCCRLVDAGWLIAQRPDARVHHKFLPSHIRDSNRITVKKYAVLKNKIYFSFANNRGHHSSNAVIADAMRFFDAQRADIDFHIRGGRLSQADMEGFETDVDRAWRVGLARGLEGSRRTQARAWFGDGEAFRPFPRLRPTGARRTVVFLSQRYPPGDVDGLTRYTHDMARAIAALGHDVHVLTRGDGFNRVDLEEGVWVHRMVPKAFPRRGLEDGLAIPEHIWNFSSTLLEEAIRIEQSRPIDVVEGVSWDCVTSAFVLDGRLPVATNVVTSLAHWLETHPEQSGNEQWMADFGRPMLALERLVYDRSDRIIAASDAIVESLRGLYDASFESASLARCVHGLEDMRPLTQSRPAALDSVGEGRTPVLFVGRLELRKGIDVLLRAAAQVLATREDAEFWIAGDNTLETGAGTTEQDKFLASEAGQAVADRVRFLGPVTEAELRWCYANCEVFVAPSRFESFGLIFVEAMMFEKPVVGCRAGGVPEVVRDGETGLLVDPDDADALAGAIDRLIGDEALRRRLGHAGRADFEGRFAAGVVATQRVNELSAISRRPIPDERQSVQGAVSRIQIDRLQEGRSLGIGSSLILRTEGEAVYLTFFCHDWSGIAVIAVNGEPVAEEDLYSAEPRIRTVALHLSGSPATIAVHRADRKAPASHATEVIVASVRER